LKLLTIIILLIATSCQKQSPGGVTPDYIDSLSEVRRGESCKRVNLLEDILELTNLRDLFVCTTWDKEFPELYLSLEEMDPQDWNHFAIPINDYLLNNRVIRDQILSLTKDLDRKEGLDDLGAVITSLSDSNFFSHLNGLLECSFDESRCGNEVKVSKDEVWNFFHFFVTDQELIESMSELVGAFSTSIKGDGVSFKNALKISLKDKTFKRAREVFFNQIFKRMGDPEFKEEIAFYRNMFVEELGENIGWLPRVFREEMTKGEANYLLRYPSDVHRSLWKDFRVLNKTLSVNVGCSGRVDYSDLSVDVSKHLETFITLLFKGSQEEFFRNSLQSVAIMKAANEICPDLKGYQARITSLGQQSFINHEINFVDMLERTTSLMLNQKYYDFIHLLQNSHPTDVDNELHLIKYFSGDVFASFVELLRVTDPSINGLSASLYDLIRSMPTVGIIHLGKLLRWIEEKPSEEIVAIANVWSALGKDGRFFFFNFLDSHYTEGADLGLLFDYYNALLKATSNELPKILSQVFNEENKLDILLSIKNVTKSLGKEGLIDDYKKFFSRDHLIEILKIISNGTIENQFSDVLANYTIASDDLPPVALNRTFITSNITKKCLGELIQPYNDFYSMLSGLPIDCLPLRDEDPLFKFFDEVNIMSGHISEETGTLKLFSNRGLFSPELLSSTTAIFKLISEKYKTVPGGEGLGYFLDNLNIWIGEGNRKDLLKQVFLLPKIITEKESDLIDTFSRFYGNKENFKYLNYLIDAVPLLVNSKKAYERGDYDESLTPINFTPLEGLVCENFHSKIGGRPCPSRSDIGSVIERVLGRVTKKNEDQPTALEQLMRMVATGFGLPIPYESNNPRYKRVTLSESFEMFYNFTNSSIETNNLNFEYNSIPKADSNYFETKDWEIKKKQYKGAPDPYVAKMNTMDRIEVVIRDVRFDQNYLGTHYMNAVAKAEDYNNVVDSKYGLLKTCIPLKFCGKFMNKAQHKFAKNSKETFLSLLDANTKEGWRYGDYMQSLLTSLVSSSPKKSQVSSVINKRIFGLNIKIPWLQKKEDLLDHNGKILGLASMVGMFTNSSRVLRDRVGRTDQDFQSFIKSERLSRTDAALLRNFKPELHVPKTIELLNSLKNSGFLDSFLDYVYASDYSTQRLWESLLFKGLYLSSFIGDSNALEPYGESIQDRYKDLSILDFLDIANTVVKSHELISKNWNFRDKEILQNLNHFVDVFLRELEVSESSQARMALNELVYFTKTNKKRINVFIENILTDEKLPIIKESISGSTKLLSEIKQNEARSITSFFNAYKYDTTVNWTPFRVYLQRNGAEKLCSTQGEGFDCINNPEKGEIQQVLTYLFEESGTRFFSLLDYIGGKNNSKIKELFTIIFPSLNTQSL